MLEMDRPYLPIEKRKKEKIIKKYRTNKADRQTEK